MIDILAEMGLSWQQWCLAFFCAVLIGFTKTGIGGIGVLIAPLMAMAFPAAQSPGVVLPMLVMADIFAVAYYRRHAVWQHVLKPMPWAVAGIIAAFAVLYCADFNNAIFERIIGGIILFCLAMMAFQSWRGADAPVPGHWSVAAGAGVLGGITTMIANAAGPIWMVYLTAMRLPKYEFIGTGAWFFMILNAFKLPWQAGLGNISKGSLLFDALALPAIAAGAFLGVAVVKRINQRFFTICIYVLATIAAVKLLAFPRG